MREQSVGNEEGLVPWEFCHFFLKRKMLRDSHSQKNTLL